MNSYADIELSRQLAALGCVSTSRAAYSLIDGQIFEWKFGDVVQASNYQQAFHLYDFLAPHEQARKNAVLLWPAMRWRGHPLPHSSEAGVNCNNTDSERLALVYAKNEPAAWQIIRDALARRVG